jgi:hypothetical protein
MHLVSFDLSNSMLVKGYLCDVLSKCILQNPELFHCDCLLSFDCSCSGSCETSCVVLSVRKFNSIDVLDSVKGMVPHSTQPLLTDCMHA